MPEDTLPDDAEVGMITTRVTAGWNHVPGVNLGIDRFLDKEDLNILLRVADMKDHPDFESLEHCYLQRLLEGAKLPILLEPEETDGNSNNEGNSDEDSSELFTLESVGVNNINEHGVIQLSLGADIAGVNEQFGIRGIVPPINAKLKVSGETEEDAFEDLLGIYLRSGLHLIAEQPKIPDARIDIELFICKEFISRS
jgi:hypothetical protein